MAKISGWRLSNQVAYKKNVYPLGAFFWRMEFVTFVLTGRNSISGDTGGRWCWRFFWNSAFGATAPRGPPGDIAPLFFREFLHRLNLLIYFSQTPFKKHLSDSYFSKTMKLLSTPFFKQLFFRPFKIMDIFFQTP